MSCVANVRAAHVSDNFECQANAKLIAAAPDLLAVLTDFVDEYGDDDQDGIAGQLTVKARTTIARATQ